MERRCAGSQVSSLECVKGEVCAERRLMALAVKNVLVIISSASVPAEAQEGREVNRKEV